MPLATIREPKGRHSRAAGRETDQMLTMIVNEAAKLLSAEAAAIRLLEGDELVIAARSELAGPLTTKPRLKVGESLTGRVIASGAPLAVEDLLTEGRYDTAHQRAAAELGFRSFLGVPLRTNDHPVGTLALYAKKQRRFSAEEVAVLSAFADQAALAIEKGRLLVEAEEGRQVLEGLAAVGLEMQTAATRDARLAAFIAGAHEIVGFDRMYVLLAGADGSTLEPACAHGQNGLLPPPTLSLTPEAGVFYDAFHGRQSIMVLSDGDLEKIRPFVGPHRDNGWFRTRRFVILPLLVGDRTIGVVMADNKLTRRPIDPASVEPFTLLCQQLAAVLEHERAERERVALLRLAEAQRTRLTQIFESTSDGIMLVNLQGGIESANQRARELLDFDSSATADRDLMAVLAPHFHVAAEYDRAVARFAALLRDPERADGGDLSLTATGRVLHWTGRATTDTATRTIGLTLTFQDVTEERAVSQMKSDFVSFVTHQLRTPLAGIKWMLELAAEEPAGSAEIASYIGDARESAERLIRLVNDLLDVSRLESGKLAIDAQPTDVAALTSDVLAEVASLVREKAHRLSARGLDEAPVAIVDAQLLREVVMNLVSNAIKYTPEGGDLEIDVTSANGELRWAIKDSGIGIPKEAQRRLFEKFFRADNAVTVETEGTGLGLYLVRLIVEKFGGRVWCESEAARGSRFTFVLPLAP